MQKRFECVMKKLSDARKKPSLKKEFLPSLILRFMNVKYLKLEQIHSHVQRHRKDKIEHQKRIEAATETPPSEDHVSTEGESNAASFGSGQDVGGEGGDIKEENNVPAANDEDTAPAAAGSAGVPAVPVKPMDEMENRELKESESNGVEHVAVSGGATAGVPGVEKDAILVSYVRPRDAAVCASCSSGQDDDREGDVTKEEMRKKLAEAASKRDDAHKNRDVKSRQAAQKLREMQTKPVKPESASDVRFRKQREKDQQNVKDWGS